MCPQPAGPPRLLTLASVSRVLGPHHQATVCRLVSQTSALTTPVTNPLLLAYQLESLRLLLELRQLLELRLLLELRQTLVLHPLLELRQLPEMCLLLELCVLLGLRLLLELRLLHVHPPAGA